MPLCFLTPGGRRINFGISVAVNATIRVDFSLADGQSRQALRFRTVLSLDLREYASCH